MIDVKLIPEEKVDMERIEIEYFFHQHVVKFITSTDDRNIRSIRMICLIKAISDLLLNCYAKFDGDVNEAKRRLLMEIQEVCDSQGTRTMNIKFQDWRLFMDTRC